MSDKKWKLLTSKDLFSSPYFTLKDNDYSLPDGQIAAHYYQLIRKSYVLVLVQNDSGHYLVEKQYRFGVDDFVYELPAGLMNKDELPLVAAAREVEEETGYLLKDVELLGEIYPQPGFINFKAYVVKGTISGQTAKKPDFDEVDIPMEFWSIDKIKASIKDGTIKDMGFISALSFL